MILTCPECATRYSANADAIGPNGRTVRCANCAATWFVSSDPDILSLTEQREQPALSPASIAGASAGLTSAAPKDSGPSVPAGAASAAAIRDNTDRSRARRRLFGVSMIWIVTLAILAGFAAAAYIFRQPLIERYPALSTFYKSVGVNVAKGGLTVQGVEPRGVILEGVPTLIVEGTIVNLTGQSLAPRPVMLSLHNSGGDELARWVVELSPAEIAGGSRKIFSTQYPNPPIDSSVLQWSFVGDSVQAASGDVERLTMLREADAPE